MVVIIRGRGGKEAATAIGMVANGLPRMARSFLSLDFGRTSVIIDVIYMTVSVPCTVGRT